ncbi:MAG TPA: DUF418 domain-containing transporter [Spirochaetota bacterium]|nr:DUF418 domain-containing transporter [Spirochaetota bacterium]
MAAGADHAVDFSGHGGLRIPAADALRGIAVLLMVQQHLGVWLWKVPVMPLWELFVAHPVMMGMNFCGLLAAPLFVSLSGFGSVYLHAKTERPFRVFAVRGAVIIFFGYMLNFLTPHWFTPGSWFVLHCIGFSLILAPALLRLRTAYLVLLYPAIFGAALFGQHILGTPLLLMDARMGNISMPGGVLRLIFLEGHFPVFPWVALFISGIIAGRWISAGKTKYILLTGITFITAGIVLGVLYRHGYAFATRGPLFRLFVPLPYFYPALPPLMLGLNGLALLCAGVSCRIGQQKGVRASNLLVSLGRVSLTVLFVHIALFNELFQLLGLKNTFSAVMTFVIIMITLGVCGYCAFLWRRVEYRNGLEWWVRAVSDRKWQKKLLL